jgi:hypothetical protein
MTTRTGVILLALVGGIVACWVLLMPPGAGADEHSHLVRAGAVIRGDWGETETYVLPDSYLVPEPGCYAFDPTVSARCAGWPLRTGAELAQASRASDYPIWSHSLYGVVSLVPGPAPLWWARIGGAVLATGLVAWALRTSIGRRPLATTAILLGLTPMAWSIFATVNPSSLATAGAVALWTGLLSSAVPSTIAGQWLLAAGWAALALPRRDGLIWAFITLAIALLATDRSAVDWWRSLGVPARVVIGVSTLVTVIWGATSDSRTSQLVALAPLIIVAAEAGRRWWARPDNTVRARYLGLAGAAIVGAAALAVLLSRRPGGWDTDLAVDVVAQTDENLVEAIGVLGWLDTPVPWFAVFLWLVLAGVLVAVALLSGWRTALWACVLAVTTVVTSWVFELYQGNDSATYWQGRYSVPLLIGIPMLLTLDTDRVSPAVTGLLRRADLLVGGGALLILNVAAWSAARRFGVGTRGSHLPWRWDLAIQPIPPLLVLIVHAALTTALLIFVTGRRPGFASAGGR